MPYNNVISRTDAQGLLPIQYARDILSNLPAQSAALTLFKQVSLTGRELRIPVKTALPVAYFVNGDTGLKQTTEVNWDNKFLYTEEIACIVPIPDAVADDIAAAGRDVWTEIKPDVEEAIGRALDAAIFFGVNAPSSWTDANIAANAVTAGNSVERGTNLAANGGIAGDVSDLMAALEADGFDVSGFLAKTTYKGLLRQARNTFGMRLPEVSANQIDGKNIVYPMRGLWPSGTGTVGLIGGDFSFGILGVRQEITYKVLTESVITDGDGATVYNLAMQDMSALRVVARFGFAIGNPINYDNADGSTRYPFGVMVEP